MLYYEQQQQQQQQKDIQCDGLEAGSYNKGLLLISKNIYIIIKGYAPNVGIIKG